MKLKIFSLMGCLLTSAFAMESSSWEGKEAFHALGRNYITQSLQGQIDTVESELTDMAKKEQWTLEDLKRMGDTYIVDQNPGTLLAKRISGMECQPDSQRTQGHVLVGLAQVMRKKLELSNDNLSLNLFEAGVESQKFYGSYMHQGVSHLLAAVTGRDPFIVCTLEEGGAESTFPSLHEQEHTERMIEQDTPELLNHLVSLSHQYSNGNTLGEWENLGAALYVQQLSGQCSQSEYEQTLDQIINNGFATILGALKQTQFTDEQSVETFLDETIRSYIFAILNGRLYPSKENRSIERAVQETLDAKLKMASLTVELVRKAFPQLTSPEKISGQVKELLSKQWGYNVLCEAFENINGERVPVIKDPYNNVWTEFVFGYQTASDKVEAYRKKYHPHI